MKRKRLVWLVVLLLLFAMLPMQAYADDMVITIPSTIDGVTIPVNGATPVSTLPDAAEYTATIAWSPADAVFAGNTVYTATITISPKAGYTLTGVPADSFQVTGATATNATDSGIVTAVFPATAPDTTISTQAITGVTPPVEMATPVSTLPDATDYTATIEWSPTDAAFIAGTAYTATITVTPKIGYTLTGVPENFFTVAGATATNATDSGIVTAVFPITAVEAPILQGATTSTDGGTVTLTFSKTMSDPSAEAANFIVNANGRYWDTFYLSPYGVSSATLNTDPTKIDLTLTTPVQRGDIVTLDYTPGNVMAADGATLAAISSWTVTNTIPVIIDTNLEGTWQAYDHVGNWWEGPYPGGDDPRGNVFNRHIVISGSAVTFFGNGSLPFKDFLFLPSEETAAKSFTFVLDLTGVINYHSMEGGGFLFNSIIDEGLLYGYCTLFNSANGVDLYQIKGIDVNAFHEGNPAYMSYAAPDIVSLGSYPLTGSIHNITLETSAETIDMWDGTTKVIDNVALPDEYGNGVGMIASQASHGCSLLSIFVFSDLNIQGVANLSAVLAGNQANLTFTQLEGATAVQVEQSTDGATWTPATLTAPYSSGDTSATVTGLASKQTYYFRLIITGGKYDGLSRIATASYIPGPISDLAGRGGDGTADLTFTPPEGAQSLVVMQSTNGGVSWSESTLANPITATSSAATVTGLTNGQLYSFKIVVTLGDQSVSNSNIINITPAVPSTHHHKTITEIEVPLALGTDHIAYIQGYPDNTIRPEGNITREEVAAVFYRLLDSTYRDTIKTTDSGFSDVSHKRWSAKHIGTLAKGDIISGYPDGTFKPGSFITRAELAAIASRFDKLSTVQINKFSDISGHWASKYINSAAEKGWVSGYSDGTFKPNQYITRAEFVTLVNNVLKRNVNEEGILSNAKKFPDLTKNKWYYEDMEEAMNSHNYQLSPDNVETWTEIYNANNEM